MLKCDNDDNNDAYQIIKYRNTNQQKLCRICYDSLQAAVAANPEFYGNVDQLTLVPTDAELAGGV